MCGLCGIAGQGFIAKDLDIFNDLLWVTGLRGHHSTGVFSYNPLRGKNQKFSLTKRAQPSPNFVLQDQATKIGHGVVESINARLYMGHCRYATVGNINTKNAHPFDTGRYVSAHNGTLKDKKYKHADKTDSQMMFEDMEKRSPKAVLDDLDFLSAYAVTIFDKQSKTLTLGTNGDRPLWMAVAKSRGVFYYASEKAALEFVSARHGTAMIYMKVDPYYLYTIDTDQITADSTEQFYIEELTKPEIPIITGGMQGAFDWSIMDGATVNLDDSYCCACGTLLYGKEKAEADKYPFDGKIYYTCKSCLNIKEDLEEVKVG